MLAPMIWTWPQHCLVAILNNTTTVSTSEIIKTEQQPSCNCSCKLLSPWKTYPNINNTHTNTTTMNHHDHKCVHDSLRPPHSLCVWTWLFLNSLYWLHTWTDRGEGDRIVQNEVAAVVGVIWRGEAHSYRLYRQFGVLQSPLNSWNGNVQQPLPPS